MIKRFLIIVSFFFGVGYYSYAQISGCTDPQANNYNAAATINNGSCTYNTTNITLTEKTPLSTPLLDESSGVEFLSGKLWTHNDSGNSNDIYRVDTTSTTVFQTVNISNATNTDWEDMTSSNDYLFVGDFGNNNGNRQNLKIYRIDRSALTPGATSVTAAIINFSYSDQSSFPSLPNNNNFDCESMIFFNDSIHLFSKNWVDKQTRHYVLPNVPGTHVAQYRETLNAGYLVTSASVQKGGVIALLGYDNTGIGPIYIYMLYDYKNNFFFNGNKRKFNVSNMATYGQTEGIEFLNGAYGYISNERFNNVVNIAPKLRSFNLASYLPNAFVYPKPKAALAASITTACAGTTIGFTDQSENDPTSWQWSFPGGSPSSSTLQNPVVQYNVAGTYSVTLVATNATGSDTIVKTNYITINALPVVTANNVSGCAGTSIALSGTPAGGTWSVANPYTGSSTTYTHTYTNANGCTNTSAPASITVNANPTPTISGPSSFCTGGSVVLDAGAGYSSYSWLPGGITQTITVTTGSTYSVTVTNANGCTGIATKTVTQNPSPSPVISGNTQYCPGSFTVLNAGAGYSAYNWSNGATTQSVNAGTTAQYSVTVTNTFGCTGTSLAVPVSSYPAVIVTISGNTSLCQGNTTTLNAGAGFSSYIWSNAATTPTILVSTSGVYTVTVTNANECTGSASATIIVNPLPVVSFSGLAASYNVSSAAATLTGSPVGGTFSGPGISGNIFTPSAAGVGGPYTITYSFTDVNGCSNSSSKQTSVTNCTVTAQPGSITSIGGTAKMCPGDNKSYKINAVSGATSYTWTPPSGANITSGQGTIQVTVNYTTAFTASGTLSVVANNACGSSAPRNLTITRNTPSTPGVITGLAYGVCNSSAVPYSIVNVAGMNYNWSFNVGTATVAGGQGSNSITANFGAGYVTGQLKVNATNACGTSANRTLSIKATPATPTSIAGATSVCANQSGVPYSISPVATATAYTWTGMTGSHISDGVTTSSGTTLNTTATSVTVNFGNTAGTLNVKAKNACGAGSNKSLAISFSCREMSDEITSNEFNVTVSPNPVSADLNVYVVSEKNSNCIILLNDVLGRTKIQLNAVSLKGENNYHLKTEGLASGIYFLNLINGEQKKVVRVVVD